MKFAIIGAGGVGGYFGGLLAKAGHDVTFLARGRHLAAMRQKGLRVKSVHGDFHLQPVQVVDSTTELGWVDYVVVCVKNYDLKATFPAIRPLIGPRTTVVPLLNGVEAHRYLIEAFGERPVVGGLCFISSAIESPGIIRQISQARRVVVGELQRKPSSRVSRFIRALADCGVDAVQPDDIYVALWTKLLFIAGFSGISALARTNAGELVSCRETRQLFIGSMEETRAVAGGLGIQLEPEVVEKTLAIAEGFEPQIKPSMQLDVEKGKPFELDAFSGAIVKAGEQLDIPTPIHSMIYSLLRPALIKAMAGRKPY